MDDHSCSNVARISEPFRIYFPIGMLVGLAGVALWPLFYTGNLPYYPGVAHTRLMIEGFAGLFIFGFLMTAGPRLLDVPAFSKISVCSILVLECLSSIAHLANHSVAGDLFFSAAIIWMLMRIRSKFGKRQDTPPPGFPLAALGLLCGVVGSLALATSMTIWPNATVYQLGKILLFQGFTFLPVVGVGAFFFPRILGSLNKHDFPTMQHPNASWKQRFTRSVLVAIAFFVSVILELTNHIQFAYGLRLVAFAAYMLSEIPFGSFKLKQSMHGLQLIFTLGTIVIGLAGATFFPGHRIAWLHAYFLTGLTSIIFLVSLRVVFGHSGRPDLIRRSVKISMWVTFVLVAAAAARIFADYSPGQQINLYLIAAGAWLFCGLLWMALVAPKAPLPNKKNPGGC